MCFQESKCSSYRSFISNLITCNLSKSIFYIRISTEKQAFDFLKRNSYTNTCLKFLFDAKLITSLIIFLISSKKLKAASLSFIWFNDSRTREFELLTRGFELITRGFELVPREFELVTREFEQVSREFEPITRGAELVTHGFELVNRGFELALLKFNSCF